MSYNWVVPSSNAKKWIVSYSNENEMSEKGWKAACILNQCPLSKERANTLTFHVHLGTILEKPKWWLWLPLSSLIHLGFFAARHGPMLVRTPHCTWAGQFAPDNRRFSGPLGGLPQLTKDRALRLPAHNQGRHSEAQKPLTQHQVLWSLRYYGLTIFSKEQVFLILPKPARQLM